MSTSPELGEHGEWVRGFELLHQSLDLTIDFSGHAILGRTGLTIVPQSNSSSASASARSALRELRLHSRQCVIKSVTIDGHPAEFDHPHDFLGNVAKDSVRDLMTYSALYAGDLEVRESSRDFALAVLSRLPVCLFACLLACLLVCLLAVIAC
jgi:hypothetical protein